MRFSESHRDEILTRTGTAVILPRCKICGNVPEKGIAGGMKFRRAFICNECEKKIVSLDVGSQEYQMILATIKSILGL